MSGVFTAEGSKDFKQLFLSCLRPKPGKLQSTETENTPDIDAKPMTLNRIATLSSEGREKVDAFARPTWKRGSSPSYVKLRVSKARLARMERFDVGYTLLQTAWTYPRQGYTQHRLRPRLIRISFIRHPLHLSWR
ncbi:hypothetical protein V2G26_007919 [Clonostachys chloroleuca]